MIDIRYDTETYPFPISVPLLGLNGNPTMSHNCYYVPGKNATFSDQRIGSLLNKGNLAAWQTHISGDAGSLEVDPAFDANYMPTNILCNEMGIEHPLIINGQTGIKPIPNDRLRVYPNPTTGELRMENGEWRMENVEIYDVYGRMIVIPNEAQRNEESITINISRLPAGIYLLKIETENETITKKIIKN
jgi:hypothetical protein